MPKAKTRKRRCKICKKWFMPDVRTLKKKILSGYGVAFALMGLVVALAVMNLVSLGEATEAILSERAARVAVRAI